MKRAFILSISALLVVGMSVTPPSVKADNSDRRVLVCHTQPGNPRHGQEINVDVRAVPGHLGHGDFLGSCSVLELPQ